MTAIELAACEAEKLHITQKLLEEMLESEAEYLDVRESPSDRVHDANSAQYHACCCHDCWSLRHMMCKCNSDCKQCIVNGCKSCDDCYGNFHELTVMCQQQAVKLEIPIHLVFGLMKFYY
jgi:hypothetical protein